MNVHQAKSVIANYMPYMTVAEVYDEDAEFRTAINTLFPDFEYPDFSHKTIAVVLGDYRNRVRRELNYDKYRKGGV